jgi:hypothetical protein
MFAPALLAILLQALPFTSGWELRGDAVRERVQERDTLRIDNGWAYRRDVQLQDGTIDFDAQLSRRRSFLYLCVRMQDDAEYEEIYLRAHKSELPDALQYAPVYQGQSAWQLHHGPGKTAAVRFDPGRWTHVRVVLKGRRMAVFLDDMTRPVLLVPNVARDPRPGFIAVRAFTPPDTPGDSPSARFANVRIDAGPPAVDIDALAVPPAADEPGRVRAWMIAGPVSWTPGDALPALPEAARTSAYRSVTSDPSGLIELHRHVTMPAKSRELTAAAVFRVTADRAGVRVFDLGFSDRATVFVNDRPVFRGEASYSYAGRREGLIGFDQARLYLPLEAGTNDVVVMLSDSFGGMGLMGRFPDAAGLVVEAR